MSIFSDLVLSHRRAGTGAVLVETNDEIQALKELLAALPANTSICTCAAPGGDLVNARTKKPEGAIKGLADVKDSAGKLITTGAYTWCAGSAGRVLVVHDWHALCNSPGHWRLLLDTLPRVRSPKDAKAGDTASLIVFVAPSWEMIAQNPLRGLLPTIPLDPPGREGLADVASAVRALPDGEKDSIVDALCGLSAAAAEQVSAEVLSRCGKWDTSALQQGRAAVLREAGIELRDPIQEDGYGGMALLKRDMNQRIIPFLRDPQLSVRRLLWAGVHGVGKSMGAQLLAGKLNTLCAVLSLPKLKDGIVGGSERKLNAAIRACSAVGRYSPLVVVLDEIDSIPKNGLDGGSSAGMWAILGEWLQEDKSQVIVIGTTNRYDLLDTALTQRFGRGYFFDLPSAMERTEIAQIHFKRCGAQQWKKWGEFLGQDSEGYSGREISLNLVPDLVALAGRDSVPNSDLVREVRNSFCPTSVSQADQLAAVRRSASSLRPANARDDDTSAPRSRQVV